MDTYAAFLKGELSRGREHKVFVLDWEKIVRIMKNENATSASAGILRGEAPRGREHKVFDWEKAVRIMKKENATSASAGLSEDWEYTGGLILLNGRPSPKEYKNTYLASTWATPVLRIKGEEFSCYRMESKTPGWDAKTYWPEEALALLNSDDTSLSSNQDLNTAF